MDESTLIAGMAAGDHRATHELIGQHFSTVYRFLHHLTRSREDAEDLAQQTLLKAVREVKRFDGRSPLRSWLFGIAVREYSRWRRKRVFSPFLQNAQSADDPMQKIVDARLLLDALEKLSVGHRSTFLLHHVEGLSLEEIAEALGVPVGTVKSRLHVARERLRELLEREEFYVTEPCRP